MTCSSTPAVVLPMDRQYEAALAAASWTAMPALRKSGGNCLCACCASVRMSQRCLTSGCLLSSVSTGVIAAWAVAAAGVVVSSLCLGRLALPRWRAFVIFLITGWAL